MPRNGLLLSFLMTGMAIAQTAPSSAPAPGIDPPTTAQMLSQTGGSLFKASHAVGEPGRSRLASVSLFAVPEPQPKTIKKHDLVTIIIREVSEMTTDGTTDLKKDSVLDARLEEWVKMNWKNWALEGGAQGDNPPSVRLSGNREFKGEAKLDRTDSFIARITGEVVDVKPNGTFVVQARKRIKKDEEEQEFILTGICRASDVTPDNTVLSTQVYDMNLVTKTKGAVRDTTKRGFIPRLLDFVNPF